MTDSWQTGSKPTLKPADAQLRVYRVLSSDATTNLFSIKSSHGRLYRITGYNNSNGLRFLKLFNKPNAPILGKDVPLVTEVLAPCQKFQLDWAALGFDFQQGIAIAITGGGLDGDKTILNPGDVIGLNVYYA